MYRVKDNHIVAVVTEICGLREGEGVGVVRLLWGSGWVAVVSYTNPTKQTWAACSAHLY